MNISTLFFMLTGTFLTWALKGFKGKFDDEMVSTGERFSVKGNVRYFSGIAFWMVVAIVIYGIVKD